MSTINYNGWSQGWQPETRTFNTAIIACNMCNQSVQALQVSASLLATCFWLLLLLKLMLFLLSLLLLLLLLLLSLSLLLLFLLLLALMLLLFVAPKGQVANACTVHAASALISIAGTMRLLLCRASAEQDLAGLMGVQVYERMQAQGLEPTATTYTALVSAHCKSDNLTAALEV